MKESFGAPSYKPEDNNENPEEEKRSLANKAGLGAAALAAGIGAAGVANAETPSAEQDNAHTYEVQAESNIDLSRPAAELETQELVGIINTHELGTLVRGGTPLVTPDMNRELLDMMYETLQGLNDISENHPGSKKNSGGMSGSERNFSLDVEVNGNTVVDIDHSSNSDDAASK